MHVASPHVKPNIFKTISPPAFPFNIRRNSDSVAYLTGEMYESNLTVKFASVPEFA